MTDQLTDTDALDFELEQQPGADAAIDARLVRRRRRWPALLLGTAIGAGGAVAVNAYVNRDSADPAAADLNEVVTLTTAAVESRDLVEEVEWSGTLAAGLSVSVNSPVSGTITRAVADGDTVGRGDAVAWIDEQPVVAMIGSIPMWRNLANGDEGDDVRQLETNLVALGYGADLDVVVDDSYDSDTADMVEAWQAALGVDETGKVTTSQIVVIPGESTVATAPIVGASAQSGAELAVLDTFSQSFDVVGWDATVDRVADPGTPVVQGTVLYTADGTDVVAVLDPDSNSQALLTAFADEDVEQIESILVYLGFDPDRVITIDDEPELGTAAAVMRWQQSIGLPETGSFDADDYVVVPTDREYTVGDATAAAGDALGGGTLVMTLGSPTLELSADVAVSEQGEFAVDDAVTVTQVDDTVFDAVVADIADATGGDGDAEPTMHVTFAVTSEPEQFISGTVTVTSESSRIDGATVVPTRALVTLREGGFAVEKQNADGSTTLVGVELGTFDDGVVEITSGDIAPGDQVVVPT